MDFKLFLPKYASCHLVLLLREVVEWYQNEYLMTYIDRPKKEKEKENIFFSLFDIFE